MNSLLEKYEVVIGLETHIELKTETKIFCSCSTAYGAAPNTQCCPVCTGMPGALPVLNRKAVEYAVKAGMLLHCQTALASQMDRKNYFYPDLPKAYQISQYGLPLCRDGWVDIETETGKKRIRVQRVHLEEDAGKLLHREGETLVDCNRCGVPLIEIVTEPDFRSGQEAAAYLQKLRELIRFAGLSDCKMNEGSLRCDVNLSVRKKGEARLGVRTELKNLNSFQFVAKAARYEARRQMELLEQGGAVVQETRRFDEASGKTLPMRRKETLADYRFFPEPDLPPVLVSQEEWERWRRELPETAEERRARYGREYGLPPESAAAVTAAPELAAWFEQAAAGTRFPRLAANLVAGEVLRLLPSPEEPVPFSPARLAVLADLLGEGAVNSSTAKALVGMLWRQDQDPRALVEELGLGQLRDRESLLPLARQALREQPKAASDYRAGKKAALQALAGQLMRKTRGRANPALAKALLQELLDSPEEEEA